uniref:Claspin n=1 Tax=Trichuris muris TaxID=70415 RepID=A0A5S6QW00_TRIMR
MSSVALSTMQEQPVQVLLPVKSAIVPSLLGKPKLSATDDGFVDLNEWNVANKSPSSLLLPEQASQDSQPARTGDSQELLVGNSWWSLKKNLESKIKNKRQEGLKNRYELWNEDQLQSAIMEEKLPSPFIERDESTDDELDSSLFSEDETLDGQAASGDNIASTEVESLPRSNPHTSSGSFAELGDGLLDEKLSKNVRVDLRSPPEDEHCSDEEKEASFNLAPRAIVSSDDDDDDSNLDVHPGPTLNTTARSTAPETAFANDSQAEPQLSMSDLFAQPSDSSSDLALAKLFFDDSKQDDSFSSRVDSFTGAHSTQGAELSPLRKSLVSDQLNHEEGLSNFGASAAYIPAGLNCNTESFSLENLCSGEFPDSGDQVMGSNHSKSYSSLPVDRFDVDTNGASSPVGYFKKQYHGLMLDNDSAEETDDLELLCSAPFASTPVAAIKPSSYRLETVLDENARDGYPPLKPITNVAKVNPDLFGTEDDSDASDKEDNNMLDNEPSGRTSWKDNQSHRQQLLRSDFLDIEAELSGSDHSGDEEEVDDDDEYEEDFVDSTADLKSAGELRAEIARIHARKMDEEDARMVNLFKEKLLESHEVRPGLRQRRMGWAAVREEPQEVELNDTREDPSELLIDDSLSRWQMARRRKAEWLLEQEDPLNSDDSVTESNTASVIFDYGMQVRGTSSNSRQLNKLPTVAGVVEDGTIELTANRMESHLSESLLRREQSTLELAFKSASESNDTKNSAFIPLSPDPNDDCCAQSESIPLQKRRRMAAEQCGETIFQHI